MACLILVVLELSYPIRVHTLLYPVSLNKLIFNDYPTKNHRISDFSCLSLLMWSNGIIYYFIMILSKQPGGERGLRRHQNNTKLLVSSGRRTKLFPSGRLKKIVLRCTLAIYFNMFAQSNYRCYLAEYIIYVTKTLFLYYWFNHTKKIVRPSPWCRHNLSR